MQGPCHEKGNAESGSDLRPLVRRLPDADARDRLFPWLFAEAIEAFDHWVAFGLLAIIGINMLKEALEKEDESGDDPEKDADLSVRTMFLMAVATSIDALAVGISLAMVGSVNIWLAAAFIGICTCLLSALGVKIGNLFGSRYEKKAEFAGGVILILLGVKILLEHLGVLA